MLNPNINNTTQAQQPLNLTNTRLANKGESDATVSAANTAIEQPNNEIQITQPQPSLTQLQSAVDNINKILIQDNKGVEFSVDSSTKKSIVKVVDSTTGDLIRQFPSEEGLSLTRAIDRIQNGLLLTQKA